MRANRKLQRMGCGEEGDEFEEGEISGSLDWQIWVYRRSVVSKTSIGAPASNQGPQRNTLIGKRGQDDSSTTREEKCQVKEPPAAAPFKQTQTKNFKCNLSDNNWRQKIKKKRKTKESRTSRPLQRGGGKVSREGGRDSSSTRIGVARVVGVVQKLKRGEDSQISVESKKKKLP